MEGGMTVRLSKLTKTSKPHGNLNCLMITLALALANQVAAAQTILPPDVRPTCTVTKKDFKAWFAPDGTVVPPDSAKFSQDDGTCSFFKWAERMFLWVT